MNVVVSAGGDVVVVVIPEVIVALRDVEAVVSKVFSRLSFPSVSYRTGIIHSLLPRQG